MYTVIMLYILILLLIFMAKPAMIFNTDGSLKHFGYNNTNSSMSLLNIEVVLFTTAICCYFFVISIELMID